MSVPHDMTISRRLAGRYLKIELLGISSSFDFVFDKLTFKAQTSVSNEAPALASTTDPLVRHIYEVGLNTLKAVSYTHLSPSSILHPAANL